MHCPTLKPPENGYFIQNTCHNHFNAACGVRCHPGFDLVGSSILLCQPNGLWSGSESSCKGMRIASSHCLLIVLLEFLDLNSNGPVSSLFLLISSATDHRKKKNYRKFEVRTTKFSWPHHCESCLYNSSVNEQGKGLPGKEMDRLPQTSDFKQPRLGARGREGILMPAVIAGLKAPQQ